MKKIYSYVLMVAALLIGTNAWADVHPTWVDGVDEAKVSKDGGNTWMYATLLKDAFDYVAMDETAEIVLLRGVTLSNTITMPKAGDIAPANMVGASAKPGQVIELDLNGQTISGAITLIHIVKGNLDITGSGVIEKTGSGNTTLSSCAVIALTGAQDSQAANWSVLTVGENITLTSSSRYTITVTNFNQSGYPAEKSYNAEKADEQIEKFGYATRALYEVWKNDTKTADQAKNLLDQYVNGAYTVDNKEIFPMACAEVTRPGTTSGTYKGLLQGCAFGVKVTIKGTVTNTNTSKGYGVEVNGNINQTPECAGANAKFPKIIIEKGAKVSASGNGGCVGVYSAGYSVMEIHGEVSGATGIYMKSGDIVLNNANVWSTYANHVTNTGGNSGVGNAGGSAIAIESSDFYAGGAGVTIQGDTKVTGGGGYALEDHVTTSQDNSTVSHITIEGGTFEPGTNGGTILLQSEDIENTTISSGQIAGVITVENTETGEQEEIEVTTITNSNTSTVTAVTDENGKITYVVTPGKSTNIAESSVVYNAAKDSIKWTGTSETLAGNQTLGYLEINEMLDATHAKAQTLIIPEGKTLTVGRVVLGHGAQIIVEAGGKFIVTGAQGIVAPKPENILLKSSESAQAYFLFNPNVTSNKYPNATVEFESKAYANQLTDKWVYQRFGVPTWDREGTNTNPKHYNTAMKSMHTDYGDSWVAEFDYSTGHWGAWGSFTGANYTIEDALPFRGYMLASNNAKANKMKYEFAGQLIGNQSENLHMYNGWNYFANSYTAPVDIKEFINTVIATLGEENKNKILATVYLYMDSGNDDYIWYGVNKTNAGEVGFMIVGEDIQQFTIPTTILPMQAFLLRLNTIGDQADQAINYERNVYNPYMNIPNAPITAPARMAQTDNKMQILVSGNSSWDKVQIIENDNFSNEMDNGYDAYKFNENKGVSLYALNGEANMDIFATDDAEGTFIGIDAKQAGSYAMHIEGVEGMEYAIIDMQTNAVINAVNGTKYQFYTAEGKNDYRFQIVSASKVVTDIDNVEIKENVKGVYTITGQYLGENVDALPAGLYIINGVKVVK